MSNARDDRGETLLELLIAITLLSVCVIAFGTSIAVGVRTSDQNRTQSGTQVFLRNWAEKINAYVAAGNYVGCASANAYAPATVGLAVPSGYSPSQSAGLTYSGSAWATCATDNGTQLLTLTTASSDGRANESLSVVIRKP